MQSVRRSFRKDCLVARSKTPPREPFTQERRLEMMCPWVSLGPRCSWAGGLMKFLHFRNVTKWLAQGVLPHLGRKRRNLPQTRSISLAVIT